MVVTYLEDYVCISFLLDCSDTNVEMKLSANHNLTKALFYTIHDAFERNVLKGLPLLEHLDALKVILDDLETMPTHGDLHKEGLQRICACVVDILALIFYYWSQIKAHVANSEVLSICFFMQSVALQLGRLYFGAKNSDGIFIALTFNLIFQSLCESNESAVIRLMKILQMHNANFKSMLEPEIGRAHV